MPTTALQKLFFAFITVLLSVFAFTNYNIAHSAGSMSNRVFLLSLKELPVEFCFAFVIQFFFVNRVTPKMAFRIVDPKVDKPIVIILAITCMNIVLMCPIMSFITTIIYDGITVNFIADWFQKMVINFPFAFFIQLFAIGPIVRKIFRLVFNSHCQKTGSA